MYKQTYLFTRKDDNGRLREKRQQYVLHMTQFSVQFSSVVSDSLWPHEQQHARPPCPSPAPGFTHYKKLFYTILHIIWKQYVK